MLVRDPYSGYLHEVPTYGGYSGYGYAEPPFEEAPDLSGYEMGQVVYDGLGNPVGLLPAILPLIASALPAIAGAAKAAIPAIASAIPQMANVVSSLVPAAGGGPLPLPPMPVPMGPVPVPMPMLPAPTGPAVAPYPSSSYGPPAGSTMVGPNQMRFVRRPRRRRFHVG